MIFHHEELLYIRYFYLKIKSKSKKFRREEYLPAKILKHLQFHYEPLNWKLLGNTILYLYESMTLSCSELLIFSFSCGCSFIQGHVVVVVYTVQCNHRSQTSAFEDIWTYSYQLLSTHCREFLYLKLYNLVKYIIRHGLPNNQTSLIYYWTDFTSIVMSRYLLHFNQGE